MHLLSRLFRMVQKTYSLQGTLLLEMKSSSLWLSSWLFFYKRTPHECFIPSNGSRFRCNGPELKGILLCRGRTGEAATRTQALIRTQTLNLTLLTSNTAFPGQNSAAKRYAIHQLIRRHLFPHEYSRVVSGHPAKRKSNHLSSGMMSFFFH